MSDIQISQVSWSSKQGNLLQAINRIMSLFGNLTFRTSPVHTTPKVGKRVHTSRTQRTVLFSAKGDAGSAPPPQRNIVRSPSLLSIPFDGEDVDVVRVEGLRHAHVKLDARQYKTSAFAEQLLEIVRALRMPLWYNCDISPETLKIQKVSGSLTNAVYFVSCPSLPNVPIILLRIYGPSSGSLISRPKELHTLHVLSSQYHIGPRVYGTFENGRVEEYFDSTALTAEEMREPTVSSWIGARMAELHQVDVVSVAEQTRASVPPSDAESSDDPLQIGVKKNVKSWIATAREVLALPAVSEELREALDLDTFEKEWERYTQWVEATEAQMGASPIVFAHNDAQYGNLLRRTSSEPGEPEHRQIIVVDFEYASPNPAAFDIANHFHEWTANYHGDTPHILRPDRYPSLNERRNFYAAYLAHHEGSAASTGARPTPVDSMNPKMDILEAQVRVWSPASHAMWAVWGIVQAREALEEKDGEPEFDYVGYSRCRLESFRREIHALSV